METFLLVLSVVLTLSYIFSQLFKRYHYPEVIAQIITGLFLGIPILKNIFFPGGDVISVFSEIGIVFLLLLTGMEIDYRQLLKEKKEIFMVALFSFIVPFLFGFFAMHLMGYSVVVAIIVGFSLSLTAEGTKLKLLMDFDLLKTRLGEIMIGAGIADDVFEVIGLGFVLLISTGNSELIWYQFVVEILIFSFIIFLLLKYLPRLIHNIKESSTEIENFTLVLILGLITTFVAQVLNLGTIIGAFIAGIIVHKLFKTKREEKNMLKDLKVITFGFIVPFFFVNIGLQFNYDYVLTNYLLFIIIFLAAVLGKILGSVIVSFFTDITLKQSVLIGWAMNSRGAVELIIVGVAKASNLISDDLFNAIVIMTIITTLLFPIVLKRTLAKDPNIMN